jgi:ligand-binding sensor domain-containing protein/signal transduction histidine kinase
MVKGQGNQLLKDYTIKVWSNIEGLPSNNLTHVIKDQRGYLWISTYDGCVRFDGTEFKSFDSKNVPELSTSAIHSALSLPDSSLYFSTQSSGLLYYKKGKFSSPFANSILPDNIMLSFKSPDGTLWVGSGYSGLYFIKNNIVKKYSIPAFENIRISGIALDSLNAMWVSSEGAGVAKITDAGYELYTEADGLLSNVVHTVASMNDNVYFGTTHGLSVYENGQWSTHEKFKRTAIFQILPDSDHNLWFATVLGLAKISANNEYDFITVEDGLPERAINWIETDRDKNIWLATYRGGLAQLKRSSFKNFTPKDGLNYHNVNIISEAPDGRYFIGDNDGGISIIDNGYISKLHLNIDIKSVIVKDILVEEDGTIWIGTYRGLIKLDGKSEKVYNKSNGLSSNKIRRLLKNEDGSIWVASRRGGIDVIRKNGGIKNLAVKDGLGSDFVFCLEKAFNGDIYAGTANVGLNIIRKDYSIDIINPDSIFSSKSIFNIYPENEKRIWLATNSGLYHYNLESKEFYLINPSKGLPVESIFDVIEDDDNNLWLTTILGIIKIRKQDALELVEGKIDVIASKIYDDSDGMITRECTGVTKSLLAEDGRIWIPTIKGVSVLDPKNIFNNNPIPPTVYIENVIVDDVPIDKFSGGHLDREVVIEPGHRTYIFKYTTLSMYSPEKVNFKYKLEGFSEDWIQVGSERQAKYTNLPYGEYTFKVVASDNSGVWSGSVAELNLFVTPYFYETKAFVVLAITIFIVLTYTIYTLQTRAVSRRNRELVKLNSELDRFAYSVSHDLKAPLSSIQGLVNVARLDEGANASIYYDRIEKSVDKLNKFIKDIINYSKNSRLVVTKELINIRSLVEQVMEGLSNVHEENEINIVVDINSNLNIKTDKARFVFILNNLITNALRYADLEKEAPFVHIKASIIKNKLVFTVIDNGQGIEKKHHKKIFEMFFRANEKSTGSGLGLYIVNESTTKLGGKIELESEYKMGTTMRLILPI